jgi:hypothetical protein
MEEMKSIIVKLQKCDTLKHADVLILCRRGRIWKVAVLID